MTSRMPVECPLCHRELADEEVQDHLQQKHSKAELAQAVANLYEENPENRSGD